MKGERFATRVIGAIGITTAIFIATQYVSFLFTQVEQVTLIEWYFRAVVIECGVLMLKRFMEVIVGRIAKKEKLKINNHESEDI